MGVLCSKCQHENPEGTRYCGNCANPLKSVEGVSVTKTLVTQKINLQKGSTLAGRYTIIEELGRGGMGVVYKAEDIKLKRTVALKFLPSELTHIPDIRDRFMREAQAAAALDHPNICTVYEFDEAEDTNFISMAYIEGQSLRTKIESGPLELEEALKIANQVAEGLKEAHKKGIVHRDIKSANVMVTENNQAKIMDFGLARTTEGTLLTQDGITMGTVTYMSPEQARGREVDHRTDIWSLGVVLYEMLTGQLPFRGEHEQAIVYSILKENPEPITDITADIPVSIAQVVSKALEKDLDKRYQQAEELLDDLKSISAGIVPEEIKARLRKENLRKRKKAILYAGTAGLIFIMVVLALTLFKGHAEAIDSIAVLPLKNLTGDAGQELFVDLVTDELIGQLAQISGLRRVISRTTVMKYKGVEKPVPEIARELNVDALVDGTVYQVGENIRIRLQLIKAIPEEHNLWAQTYERAMTDVLVMYSEIARAIADTMQVNLTEEETTRFTNARQVNPEAYEACLKGMSHWYKLTPPDFDAAQQYFESALEKDPNYALAHAGMYLVLAGRAQIGLVPPGEVLIEAKPFLLKALELDNTLVESQFALAAMKTWLEWDWEGGEAAFLRAIELKPNYALARVYYSNLLCYLNRSEEALVQAERALELDPLNSLIKGIYGNALVHLGKYDEAILLARNALKTSPNDPVGHSILWETHHIKGMHEVALVEAKAFFAGLGLGQLGEIMDQGYEKGGYAGAIAAAAETMAEFSKMTYVMPWLLTYLYAFAGEIDKAIDWLEKGYEIKDPNMPYIGGGVIFETLGHNPRYQDIIRRMNLPTSE